MSIPSIRIELIIYLFRSYLIYVFEHTALNKRITFQVLTGYYSRYDEYKCGKPNTVIVVYLFILSP